VPPEDVGRPLATVGALVLNPEGAGLFVRTRKWRGAWGVPGGKIEAGETMLDAVVREFSEETGLVIGDVRWAPTLEAVRHPEFHVPAHFVLLNMTARIEGGDVELNDEADAYVWLPLRDALTSLRLNEPTRALVRHVLRAGPYGPPVTRGMRT